MKEILSSKISYLILYYCFPLLREYNDFDKMHSNTISSQKSFSISFITISENIISNNAISLISFVEFLYSFWRFRKPRFHRFYLLDNFFHAGWGLCVLSPSFWYFEHFRFELFRFFSDFPDNFPFTRYLIHMPKGGFKENFRLNTINEIESVDFPPFFDPA